MIVCSLHFSILTIALCVYPWARSSWIDLRFSMALCYSIISVGCHRKMSSWSQQCPQKLTSRPRSGLHVIQYR